MNKTWGIMTQDTLWCNSGDADFNLWSSGALNVWSVEWYYTLVEHFNSTGGTRKWQGRLRAASQQYHREYKKDRRWLIRQPAVTGDGVSSLYIKHLRGWRDFKCFFSLSVFLSYLAGGWHAPDHRFSGSDPFETHVWAGAFPVLNPFASKCFGWCWQAGLSGVRFFSAAVLIFVFCARAARNVSPKHN